MDSPGLILSSVIYDYAETYYPHVGTANSIPAIYHPSTAATHFAITSTYSALSDAVTNPSSRIAHAATPAILSGAASPISTLVAESPSSESPDSSPDTGKLIPTPRRNTTVRPDTPHPAPRANRWKCPYCPYVQRSKRTPDLKRHIDTHTGSTADWVCCGVPLIDAGEHGVPVETQREAPFEYAGMFMVGGCRKTFSRKDALARHLRTFEGVCFGDVSALYMPGNRGGAR